MSPPPGKKRGSRGAPQRPNRSPQRGIRHNRGAPPPARGLLRMRRLDGNRFALQKPAAAFEREDDLDEVQQMIAAGEFEIARDELLYLVADSRSFLEAHNLLGELALEEEDIGLARGHFGFAYEVGLDSLGSDFKGILPAGRDYNREFFRAGRGVARCLIARGDRAEGRAILEKLLKLDSRESESRGLLEELDEQDRTGNIPPPLKERELPRDDDGDDEGDIEPNEPEVYELGILPAHFDSDLEDDADSPDANSSSVGNENSGTEKDRTDDK